MLHTILHDSLHLNREPRTVDPIPETQVRMRQEDGAVVGKPPRRSLATARETTWFPSGFSCHRKRNQSFSCGGKRTTTFSPPRSQVRMLQEDGAVLGKPQTSRGSVEEVFNDLQGTHTLHPTLHSTPSTLHPTPCPTPHTLLPTPFTLSFNDLPTRRYGAGRDARGDPQPVAREFCIDNLLVRIHFIIVMIRWTGLAQVRCRR